MAKFKVEMIVEDDSYTSEQLNHAIGLALAITELKDSISIELNAVEIGVREEDIKIEKLED